MTLGRPQGPQLLVAHRLPAGVWDSHRAVIGEQGRESIVVVHHRRVGKLAAQRFDLDAIHELLKVGHSAPASRCACPAAKYDKDRARNVRLARPEDGARWIWTGSARPTLRDINFVVSAWWVDIMQPAFRAS